MNDLIQKLIEIDSLDAQIQSLRLENPDSTRIAPRKEKRDRLLKEAFTALGREYYRNATWTPLDVVQPVDNQSGRVMIARSPDFLDEKTKAWLLDKICNTSLSFDEISNEAEALEPTCIVALWHLIDTLQEQRYNEDYLRHYSIEELKTFIEEKAVEADIARQKLHLNNLVDNSTAECYHTERMLALIKEAASAIATSGSNPEILAKLQGYINLSN